MYVFLDEMWAMTVGLAPRQADLMKGTASFVERRVKDDSIWAVLHRECHRLFPDEMFADLFAGRGRRSVPPMIVAVVMVLQRLLGLFGPGSGGGVQFRRPLEVRLRRPGFRLPGFRSHRAG